MPRKRGRLPAALVAVLAMSAGCTGPSSPRSESTASAQPSAAFNAATRAACGHVARAIAAQRRHDWHADVTALRAAWLAGQAVPGHELGPRLQSLGPLDAAAAQELADDTQTVNEVTDGLARLCGLPLAE